MTKITERDYRIFHDILEDSITIAHGKDDMFIIKMCRVAQDLLKEHI